MALTKLPKDGLATNSVSTSQIEDGTIQNNEFANGSVTSAKLANSTIANAKLSNSSFTINNIKATKVEIMDVFGRKVRTERLIQYINTFEKRNISNGFYFFNFYKKDKLIASEKIIFN